MAFVWLSSETKALYEQRPIDARRGVERIHNASAIDAEPHGNAGSRAYYAAQTAQAPRRPVIAVSSLMKAPVFTLLATQSFGDAWHAIQEKRYRHIPIVDENGSVVGIISDRDILRALAAVREGSAALSVRELTMQPLLKVMKHPVLTASPTESVRELAHAMFTEHVGCMPIVDDAGQLCGIVTRSDILRVLLNEAPLEMWL